MGVPSCRSSRFEDFFSEFFEDEGKRFRVKVYKSGVETIIFEVSRFTIQNIYDFRGIKSSHLNTLPTETPIPFFEK
jgi:hypothetical protein